MSEQAQVEAILKWAGWSYDPDYNSGFGGWGGPDGKRSSCLAPPDMTGDWLREQIGERLPGGDWEPFQIYLELETGENMLCVERLQAQILATIAQLRAALLKTVGLWKEEERMRKPEQILLGKIFAAEIENRLPWQGRSKYLSCLEDAGWIQKMERRFGGRIVCIVSGWALTEAGRLAYCESCCEKPVPSPKPGA
jgi:hypothetical protein